MMIGGADSSAHHNCFRELDDWGWKKPKIKIQTFFFEKARVEVKDEIIKTI